MLGSSFHADREEFRGLFKGKQTWAFLHPLSAPIAFVYLPLGTSAMEVLTTPIPTRREVATDPSAGPGSEFPSSTLGIIYSPSTHNMPRFFLSRPTAANLIRRKVPPPPSDSDKDRCLDAYVLWDLLVGSKVGLGETQADVVLRRVTEHSAKSEAENGKLELTCVRHVQAYDKDTNWCGRAGV